jgi:hypothetical protein
VSAELPNIAIWKSYVYHGDKCWFVSTIERNYDTAVGVIRGKETLVWNYDEEKRERGKLIHQAEGLRDHQDICRELIRNGSLPTDDEDTTPAAASCPQLGRK